VLGALLVALVVASVLLERKWAEGRSTAARYDAVLASARQEALNFTTLDYRSISDDVARVLAGSTGSFHKQFQDSEANLKTLAARNKSVSKGSVLEAGIVSSEPTKARVIVVADSMVSNVNTSTPQPRHYRLQLDLVLQGGRWLTDDLQFVG
jgi:Mce-associated membrane protein